MRPGFLRWLLLIPWLFAAGCSNYEQRWRSAAATAVTGDPFTGAYEGTWQSSQYHGASGKLWCILSREGPEVYRAEFRATWHGIFSSRHTALLGITQRKGGAGNASAEFVGGAEIRMWIGSGHYRCKGVLTPGTLEARYDANYDRGVFRLKRAH